MAVSMVLAALLSQPVQGDPQSWIAGLEGEEILPPAEMREMRAGFNWAGLEFRFGVDARTFVDGALVLQTLISESDRSPYTVTHNIPGDRPSAGAVGDLTVDIDTLRAVGVELPSLADAHGVVLSDGKGVTAAIHQVTRDRVLSVLANTASDRDLRQRIEVNVDVVNFRQFQHEARTALIQSRFADHLHGF